jgi:alkanesulfonate monooxygenase SsuD/methylene tetrahydromethanopterin reductase-like flavin-dependent oxidoreductase (luciferase family)
MKIGLLVEVEEGLDWDHWRAVYTTAERLGFESVWLSDHLESPWSNPRRGLETWTALAVAAAETSSLVLGPLVSPVSFREPAIIARMAHSLSTLAPGRFVVGLGLGWNTDEHAAAGIPFPSVAERRKRLIATIERVRCESDARILIGGGGARTLQLVARYADEWNLTTGSVSDFVGASQQLDALCAENGRDARAIRRSVASGVLIGRDEDALSARAARMQRCVPPLTGVGAAREMGWMVDTPTGIAQCVQEFAAAGVDRVIFGHYDLDDIETLELVAEAVV